MTKQTKNRHEIEVHGYDKKISQTLALAKRDLSKRNYQSVLDYDKAMKLQTLAKATRLKHLQAVLGISRKLNKEWKDVLRDDIDNLVIWIMETYADHKGQESNSSYDMKKILRLYFRWFKTGKREKLPHESEVYELQGIRLTKVKDKIVREDLITPDDLKKLLSACLTIQDKAFIHAHYEAGTRPGEILSLKLKHVKFDDYGATISVSGKTFARKIRLVESVPHLLAWFQHHPFGDNQDYPLWITTDHNQKEAYGKAWTYAGCNNKLKRLSKRAELTKPINLNLFRHSEATRTASFMTEATLRKRHGWTGNSKMSARYVHLVESDVEDAILNHHGITKKEEKIAESTPIKCQFCDMFNPPDSALCSKCSKPTTLEEAVKQDNQRQMQEDAMIQKLEETKKFLEDFEKMRPAMERRFNQFANFLETYPFEEIMENYNRKQVNRTTRTK